MWTEVKTCFVVIFFRCEADQHPELSHSHSSCALYRAGRLCPCHWEAIWDNFAPGKTIRKSINVHHHTGADAKDTLYRVLYPFNSHSAVTVPAFDSCHTAKWIDGDPETSPAHTHIESRHICSVSIFQIDIISVAMAFVMHSLIFIIYASTAFYGRYWLAPVVRNNWTDSLKIQDNERFFLTPVRWIVFGSCRGRKFVSH